MSFTVKRTLYESLPLPLKRAVRLVPFSWVAGRQYRETMARRVLFETASRDAIRAYQGEALGRMLAFATDQVPAYRTLRGAVERFHPFDALKEFPLLNKDRLQSGMSEYLPRDFERIPHYETSTGGTSGNQLTIYVDDASHAIETAFIHRLWERVGYTPAARKATFRGVSFSDLARGVYWQENPVYNELQFSPFHMSDRTMGSYVDELMRFRPEYLHGYPSAIDLLAEYILANGFEGAVPGVSAIFLASEGCLPGQRERIERAFRTRVFTHYGHSERVILAGECEHDTAYHHLPDYGILEIVAEDGTPVETDGERGELVGTGLMNRSFPLIRYRTGDLATRRAARCACGRAWDRFDDVEGHWHQYMLVGRTGARISIAALNMHGPMFRRVARYQYAQKEPGRCALRVMAAPGFDDTDRRKIEDAYRAKLGEELALTVELVDEIPLTPAGKLRVVDGIR
jgi:phenylacetate-CoA ligase